MFYDSDSEYEEAANQGCLLASDICPICKGSGKVFDYDHWNRKEWCSDCDGSGKHPDNPRKNI